jgi:hypothetical protein
MVSVRKTGEDKEGRIEEARRSLMPGGRTGLLSRLSLSLSLYIYIYII